MSTFSLGRYSKYIRTITICYDLLVLLFVLNYLLNYHFFYFYSATVIIVWLVVSMLTSYYEVYRFTSLKEIFIKSSKQFSLFALLIFCFDTLINFSIELNFLLKFFSWVLLFILGFKLITFFSLRYFRKYFNGNNRVVLTIGKDERTQQLNRFFTTKKIYGYNLKHALNEFSIETLEEIVKHEKIDEIYVSLSDFDVNQLKQIILFTDNYFINLKYIPSEKEIIIKSKNIQFYGNIPIISEYKTPLHNSFNRFIKRLFDILFSILVIVFIMSWLFPLIALLIKLDSKGPVIFKQKRNGLYYKEFDCYKFRSMYVNKEAHTLQANKNDSRVTKVGKLLRKTSLDEMPQFFNVFIGNMSVCGSRPHMLKLTEKYEKQVYRYKLRHFVKPGITGMAQTHGYRGEITSKETIINRVKYDIFYIEKWSLWMDIKIVFLTIKNMLLGDENAY
ncbi:exopolysaccharide biosynthesis polyprenyl glycosylphosphotransferase [Capnocytophaga sp. ARDL2]|uniref:exopolysaccharide biosynthesis polyprenyl glycosylphosphotransferase n=1 Tax=Capnocytophaga sp. ARDL2 TaxID=3238809 RepID=UPI003556BCBB